MEFTITQRERLQELNVPHAEQTQDFDTAKGRDACFRRLEQAYVRHGRAQLKQALKEKRAAEAILLSSRLAEWLRVTEGFTQVTTPAFLTADLLDRMTITEDHQLRDQVFWLDKKRCLRPMLAPNLYILMRDLHKITGGPVRIFEIGSCFRKESQGAEHMNEFTMLNFVEFAAVEEGQQMKRLKDLAEKAVAVAGIADYELLQEASSIYGETLDIVVDGVEVASGSFGPHRLDQNWGIFGTWAGLGIGIERLALVKSAAATIRHVGKSVRYFDGVTLSL